MANIGYICGQTKTKFECAQLVHQGEHPKHILKKSNHGLGGDTIMNKIVYVWMYGLKDIGQSPNGISSTLVELKSTYIQMVFFTTT